MRIEFANPQDLPEIMSLIHSCVHNMEAQRINQWDEIYPDKATVESDVEKRELYCLKQENCIRGIVTLNEFQEPAYQDVPWQFSGNVLVIHRLAVDPLFHGNGFARQLMQFAYERAQKLDYHAIRLDAFANNPRAIKLYERLGYHRAGSVLFRKGLFYCFEILVD